ncbi:lactate utilization protein B [Carboxylicivirga taeanensis]|uniref:lactate utilization protein B n=1 Tax=Carboxylicivirga taeanensis TaxID=1416875 RepID=UPI003F6DEFF6
MSKHTTFKKDAARVAPDLTHRRIIRYNMSRYDAAVDRGKERYSDLELAKNRASAVKKYVLQHLPDLLMQFEKKAQSNGAEVYWAENSEQLIEQLIDLLNSEQCQQLVKSKSMVTEEIELNKHLEKVGIESVETDLGEFIVQVAGEKPYHIVTPAMHKSKQDIAKLFNQQFKTDPDLSAEELTAFVRNLLRDKFINADVGITGANFLCAREGAVAVTENEGNAYLSASFPKLHVVIAGIEKVLPGIDDLPLFWPLLAAHGTGQQLTVYSNLFFGPKKANEVDGPQRMVVFLLDNKRTELYNDAHLQESLKCIRCGACLNACPVYKNIGGYTYNATYSGPIGSVISPHFKVFSSFNHLSFASSLCGKCNEVCPVKIPLTKLLLYNRQKAQVYQANTVKATNGILYRILNNRLLMSFAHGRIKTLLAAFLSPFLFRGGKKLPPFPSKSFSEQWKKNKKR